jgi:hypothetical protein
VLLIAYSLAKRSSLVEERRGKSSTLSPDRTRCRIAGAEGLGLRGETHRSLCDQEALGFTNRPAKAAWILRTMPCSDIENWIFWPLKQLQHNARGHPCSPPSFVFSVWLVARGENDVQCRGLAI